MKSEYSDSNNIFLRVALWEEYGYRDTYYGDVINFRELEVDHIIAQYYFKPENEEKLREKLQQFELPLDFKEDDLLNYTPTCRKPNIDKGKELPIGMIWHALREAKKRKEKIIKRIDSYKNGSNINELCAKLKKQFKTEQEMYNAIDVLLDDVYEFEQDEKKENGHISFYEKSTSRVYIKGGLPQEENLLPSCRIEFRTLFMRGVTISISGKEILEKLCVGNNAPYNTTLRPYISSYPSCSKKTYIINLAGCFFNLCESDVKELCELIDLYCEEYIKCLKVIEERYDLSEYSLTRNGMIKLLKIDKNIFRILVQFAKENHNYAEYKLSCNEFGNLRLENEKNKIMFITDVEMDEIYRWDTEPDMWITLKPYHTADRYIPYNQEFWHPTKVKKFILNLIEEALNCEFEQEWLGYNLLYRFITRNRFEENVKREIRRIMGNIRYCSESDKYIFEKDITEEDVLLTIVKDMQEYFLLKDAYHIYSSFEELGIYHGLIELLKKCNLEEGSYSFISSKLDYSTLATKDGLIKETQEYIALNNEQREFCATEIENVLRCYAECIDRKKNFMNCQSIKSIVKYLGILIDKYNRHIVINKFIKRV